MIISPLPLSIIFPSFPPLFQSLPLFDNPAPAMTASAQTAVPPNMPHTSLSSSFASWSALPTSAHVRLVISLAFQDDHLSILSQFNLQLTPTLDPHIPPQISGVGAIQQIHRSRHPLFTCCSRGLWPTATPSKDWMTMGHD